MTVHVEVNDKEWRRIKKQLKKLDKSYTAIGYFGRGGSPKYDLASRAAVQELGARITVTQKMKGFFAAKFGVYLKKKTIIIPKRPIMKRTFDTYVEKVNTQLDKAYDRVLTGSYSAKKALARIGEIWVGFTKLTIRSGPWKKNKPLTVKLKGSSKPLISGGELLNGVEHREIMR